MSQLRRSTRRTVPTERAETATPSTTVSSLFTGSSRVSEISLTPASSDFNEDVKEVESPLQDRATRISSARISRKRSLSESDQEIELVSSKKLKPLKNDAFVEIVVQKTSQAEVTTSSTRSKTLATLKAKKVTKSKTTSKATVKFEDAQSEGEGDILTDDELNYDEKDDESVDSDSSFEYFDDEDEDDFSPSGKRLTRSRKKAGEVIESDLTEDEDVMLEAAKRLSKQAAQHDNLNSSPSAGPSNTKSSFDAALRAAAAERRLAQERGEDDAIDLTTLTESDAFSSDDEPLSKGKGKGKGKVKGKAKSKGVKINKRESNIMTVSSMKEMKKKKKTERAERLAEERAHAKKLGRKLTQTEKSTLQMYKHHEELRNVWGDLEKAIPIVVPQKAQQPEDLKVSLLPFQLESLFWMRKQEEGVWHGGMLADEMGMGKTIQTLALFVTDRQKPNLVIAPTVAIMQWRNEIEKYTDGFKVAIWHGASRETDAATLKKFDVVLTTYAVLESAFRKQQSGFKRQGQIVKQRSLVHQIHWHRIVLDEAHNIKERSTNTAKATFELKSNYKWCLSGTPLQNRVGELYSLVRFLGGDPFSYYFCKRCDCKSLHWRFKDKRTCDDCGHSPMLHTCFWNNEILTPIQKHALSGPGETAFKKLKILLDRMMLRRTKLERADDLGLPPRTVIVRRDYFSEEEKELYLSLFSDAKRTFSTYVDSGTLLNNYSNIFSLITRMRQMACHPDLVLRSKNNASKFAGTDLDLEEAMVCRICNDIAEDALQAKCRHIFDRECIRGYLNTTIESVPKCPVCNIPLTIDLDGPAIEANQENTVAKKQGILGRLDIDKWRSSSKIEALIEELTNLRQKDATTKSLVFSQFVNFLDLIAFRLQRAGFVICRLEGTMSPQARDATIQHFMNNVHVTVFLVSLKAGGVALNLTEASRVYLMDSWWNPAVEYQAMDRIHRLGQHRPVEAIKLVIEDSIESRIVQLQEKKSAMINATLSTDDSAMGRLTPEDLGFLFRM